MKKKYTVVYSELITLGSQRTYIPKYDHVETDNLKSLISSEKYDGAVHFVFDGWCQETKD